MSRPWLTSSGWLELLLLVGRRPLQPADGRDRRQQPGELGVLRAMALDEQRAAVRVEPEGEQRGRHLARPRAQDRRIVGARQGVVVDDAVDRLELGLQRDVVADRAQVVAEVDDPGRLDPREDPRSLDGRRRAARGQGRARSSWLASVADADHPSMPAREAPNGSATIRAMSVTRPGRLGRFRDEPRPAARRRPRRGDGRPRGGPRAARPVRRLCATTARRSC